MLFRVDVVLLVLVALIATSAVSSTTSRAQTPPGQCSPTGRRVAAGDFALDNVTITIPATGTFDIGTSPPPSAGNRTIVVCFEESNVTLQLSAVTCRELSRGATTPEFNRVFDQIMASCHQTDVGLQPVVPAFIGPPGTGDAGLLSP